MRKVEWSNTVTITSKSYTCGYCGESIASNAGYIGVEQGPRGALFSCVYICHYCSQPTYITYDGKQFPGHPYGVEVKDISAKDVADLYKEARNSIACNSYTAAILCCRKLLMHIAVSKGAAEGLSFIAYIDWLSANHYVPPDGREWVDHIRTKGNEANHEIIIMGENDAKDLVDFVGMLLKIIYEFPAVVKRKSASK